MRAKLRGLRRLFSAVDDFDWRSYHVHYRAEHEYTKHYYSVDLADGDYVVHGGRLYIRGHAKPVHFGHLCLYEAVLNLPRTIRSLGEVGVGGGTFLHNFGVLLGKGVRLAGCDISGKQLGFLKELYPELAARSDLSVQALLSKTRF